MRLASQLRHQVVLETTTEAAAAGGGLDVGYSAVATVHAAFKALRGGRYVYGVQQEQVATHEATIRYRADFRDVTHLTFDGRRFIVREARDPDERKEALVLLLEEMNDDA